MSDLPQGIDLPRHRDFEGKGAGQWLRHGFLLLLTLFVLAALFNAFGAKPQTQEATAAAASLKVTAPEWVRGGLLYQARIEIHANEAIGAPTLVFDKGWIEETTVNTVEPEPAETTSDGRHLKVRYPPLEPGRTLAVYIALQANPNDVGTHNADLALYDADEEIASIDRTQVNFP
ncbi:MAG TPA: hypothetical protein VFJ53_03985 [Solirubrobacterales bacterium]|nr:hypothetical protein [Solirubrobacterales bacterium]